MIHVGVRRRNDAAPVSLSRKYRSQHDSIGSWLMVIRKVSRCSYEVLEHWQYCVAREHCLGSVFSIPNLDFSTALIKKLIMNVSLHSRVT